MNRLKWSDEEDNILRKFAFGKGNIVDMMDELNDRTDSSIRNRMYILGLKFSQEDYEVIGRTKKYRKEHSNIYRYQRDYGIVLDNNLLFNSYNEIDWWKFTYYNTPNGSKLKMLPLEICNDIEKLSNIIRYVITYEMKFDTRDKLIKLKTDDLKQYKIYYKHSCYNTVYSIIKDIFYVYDIKPFELQNSPINYWKDINNCDDFMKYFIENELQFNDNNIHLNLNNLSSIFTSQNLRDMNYNGLVYCIFTYNHYKSFYEWVNKLYPSWKLKEDNFNQFISKDGYYFDSNEEKIVYEFIKYNLNIDIKVVNKNKNFKFYNETYNENYIPDYIIKLHDKDIIIEYFGLYCNNSKNEFIKKYKEKTIRKIDFFSKLNNYKFISIYPQDLKDNFKGLQEKLQSF